MLGSEAECRVHGTAATRVPLTAVLNRAHIFSASAICFARALNDTPKLSALLLGTGMMSGWNSALAVTLMMVAGGFLLSSRVAETMGMKLSDISSAQGTTANLVTSIVVLSASACALPVSTTHVSVGSIIGAGKAANTLHLPTVRNVLLSWVVTLPVAMIGAALLLQLVQLL
jgi:PiT family inorganic phosphate transporter